MTLSNLCKILGLVLVKSSNWLFCCGECERRRGKLVLDFLV